MTSEFQFSCLANISEGNLWIHYFYTFQLESPIHFHSYLNGGFLTQCYFYIL